VYQHRHELGRRLLRPQYGCGVFVWGAGGRHAAAVSPAVLAAAGAGGAPCPDRDGPHGRRPAALRRGGQREGAVYGGAELPGQRLVEPDPPAGWDAVAPYELIPWVLGSCATLAEAKVRLARFRPLGVPLAEDLPLAPLHWH